MNSNNNFLFQAMQKWTPFSVCVILVMVFACIVIGWYTFQGMQPPIWSVTILSVFGTIMAGVGAINHGVTIANGVAKSTATAVVKEMNNASSNRETPEKEG